VNEKHLSEMTLEELWALFPIILKKHDSQYSEWYEVEKQLIDEIIKDDIARINHIGSSAVKGLVSKPTVDILLEVVAGSDIPHIIDRLYTIGWGIMKREEEPFYLVFNKGYTSDGFAEKVYHLHVRYLGDWDELYFRDYLLLYADVAKEYGDLKLRLLKDFKHDRDSYTEAKSEFVLKYSEIAKREFQNKYKP